MFPKFHIYGTRAYKLQRQYPKRYFGYSSFFHFDKGKNSSDEGFQPTFPSNPIIWKGLNKCQGLRIWSYVWLWMPLLGFEPRNSTNVFLNMHFYFLWILKRVNNILMKAVWIWSTFPLPFFVTLAAKKCPQKWVYFLLLFKWCQSLAFNFFPQKAE